jgi:thioredoxin reductase
MAKDLSITPAHPLTPYPFGVLSVASVSNYSESQDHWARYAAHEFDSDAFALRLLTINDDDVTSGELYDGTTKPRFASYVPFGIEVEDFSSTFSLPAQDRFKRVEKIIEAGAVIISTGASAKWLGIPSEERLNGFGVSACAVCDGFFFKGKEVAIVGAGDTAAEEAHYLSKMCTTVHMIVRKDQMRASKVMQDRVLNTPNIVVHFNSETDEILGDKKVEGVRIKNNKTNTMEEIPVSAFFVAIGHNPNSGIFKDYLKMDETGYILTEPGTTKTNIEGVFAAGDVQDKNYRQAVTAAGSGCMAALDAERFLTAKGH